MNVAGRTFSVAILSAILITWMYNLRFETSSGEIAPEVARRTVLLFAGLVTIGSFLGWAVALRLSTRIHISALLAAAINAGILWLYAACVWKLRGEFWRWIGPENLVLFREYLRVQFIFVAVPAASLASGLIGLLFEKLRHGREERP